MTLFDLASDEGLRKASEATAKAEASKQGTRNEWLRNLARTFDWVRAADVEERATREFQQRLWEENWVAAVGQGNISLDAALDDWEFRRWLAERSMEPLPETRAEQAQELTSLYDELIRRLKAFCTRTPHLKIIRVLAALFPGAVTTVADRGALQKLHRAMGAPRTSVPIERHAWILGRLDEVLGPHALDSDSVAQRVTIPWQLYARCVRDPEPEPPVRPGDEPGKVHLVPLPAVRRRKGLTPIRGGFSTILAALDFVGDGVTREELLDFLRSEAPDLKEGSLGSIINVLQSEFAVICREDERYILTDRGRSVLESQDADDLSDWLLTHVLGVDHVVCILRDRGPRLWNDLRTEIQQVNPGWTSNFVPQAMLGWMRNLGVIERADSERAALTELGVSWGERVHWRPESLPREPELGLVEPTGHESVRPEIRPFESINAEVSRAGHFAPSLVARLHAGLWSNERRHFAVLTGLSGSGKTLLAREYGNALDENGDGASRLLTVAVQPGWYDPGALLGYVNPLRGDSYVSTPFLEFLLRACEDPKHPHTVVLDEMNLSHPEQYMAPLLSAMETGGRIDLHTERDRIDGVPSSVPYPLNLVLIGTVNMDETTHGLSDKVLDRAYTLEFWDIDLAQYPRWGSRALSTEEEQSVRAVLEGLIAALAPARLHFGWRIVDDVLDFVATNKDVGSPLDFEEALDSVVCAKIAPKLRGDDSPRIREAMEKCHAALDQHGLVVTRDKLTELRADLEATGSARFWR